MEEKYYIKALHSTDKNSLATANKHKRIRV